MSSESNTTVAESAPDDVSHLFRNEVFFSDADLRTDVASRLERTIQGTETIEVDQYEMCVRGDMLDIRGERERIVDEYHRSTDNDEQVLAQDQLSETVEAGYEIRAALSAESMIGGAYAHTVVGPCLRLAGWCDFMAWGGWLEADIVRAEIASLMIRSHVGYAHAAGVRLTMASKLIDDLSTRTEQFGIFSDSGTNYTLTSAPGGGVVIAA